MIKNELRSLIADKKARIGVIGLGYVGLPLIVEFGLKGYEGIGFEVDQKKADDINAGRSYIVDVTDENVKACVDDGKLSATTDFGRLAECDVIIICVPTPLRKTKDPDMSFIIAAGEEIQKYLRRGQMIILESTTYPGTTDEVLLPMFEEKGFKLDDDFLLAFSPERVDPGNPQFQTHNIPKVVGGVSKDSTEIASFLYSQIVDHVHSVSSARVAEACKLWENTFRAINIGMANEMARLCNTLGIDTWEVVKAAATKPFGFMPFYPGPGIGGHCIPLDPHYLSWKARQHGFDSQFISLAEQVNSGMPAYVVKLVSTALNDVKKAVNGSKILILGVAYKKDIDDMRESPALSIIDLLRSRGADLKYHDPFVPEVTFDHAYTIGDGEPIFNQELTDELIADSDCVIICTEHSGVDYHRVCQLASLIVDTRNALSQDQRNGSNAKIVRL
ncbi:MAG: nucleotide sugar dehydrogenase [Blastocatellia bacterium]|nr:nucleotide sugar dehydrogenase [Chloracidobacterium sp.]MBL8185586.1 nucleotide sugar dehydrogenase [Blastocatellia bacterium]HBE83074.1 UDP-N-acetyl-D-glucosamine dehydrogenase [Blastocatellia bacterium]HRJ87248.1 nucleotide sugar dehydrogenase [Pyrinomonadaceae bacterium]HRK50868.1 nucleotide sugar dehydrogenase [Pyrinomonadaceae bacterium]